MPSPALPSSREATGQSRLRAGGAGAGGTAWAEEHPPDGRRAGSGTREPLPQAVSGGPVWAPEPPAQRYGQGSVLGPMSLPCELGSLGPDPLWAVTGAHSCGSWEGRGMVATGRPSLPDSRVLGPSHGRGLQG